MKRNWIIWIVKRIKGSYKFMVLLIISSIIISATNVLFAVVLKSFIDNAISRSPGKIFSLIVFAIILMLLDGFSYVLSSYSVKKIQAQTECNLRNEMFSAIIHSEYAGIEKYNSGELMNLFTNDINSISVCIPEITHNIIGQVLQAVIASVTLFILSWKMGLILFISIPVLLILVNSISPYIQKANAELKENEDSIISFVQEKLRRLPLIKAYSYYVKPSDKLSSMQDSKTKKYAKLGLVEGVVYFSNNIMGSVIFLICLGVGSYFAIRGDYSVGTMLTMVQLLNYIIAPLNTISPAMNNINNSFVSAERVERIFGLEQETDVSSKYNNAKIKEINITNLNFSYGNTKVFDDFCFIFPSNKIIGIIGKSGRGKTTLLKLLLGFYLPDSGNISAITEDNEILDIRDVRSIISYVPNSDLLFSDTIAENIVMNEEVNGLRLRNVSAQANILDFIETLPDRFDTLISEYGGNLSSGQAQRIGIARAIYRESIQVILLDEPTSNLDAESVNVLKRELKNLSMDKTCIVVSHDNTLKDIFDITLNLDEIGEVPENRELVCSGVNETSQLIIADEV